MSLIEDWVAVIFNNSSLLFLLVAIVENNKRIGRAVGVSSRQVSRLEDVRSDSPHWQSLLWRLLPSIEIFEINCSVLSLVVNRYLNTDNSSFVWLFDTANGEIRLELNPFGLRVGV